MPGLNQYQALVQAANQLTDQTPAGNLVAVITAIDAAMTNLVNAMNGAGLSDEQDMRLQTTQVNISTCLADAQGVAAGTIPAGDRLLTEGPANVLSQNVHNALGQLASVGIDFT